MAFDPVLADRVRKALGGCRAVVEKKMFGGLAFMLRGHMCCGVLKDTLVLRLGEEGAAGAFREPNVKEMDFTGRAMKTMVIVAAEGVRTDEAVERWVGRAVEFVLTLPEKKKL